MLPSTRTVACASRGITERYFFPGTIPQSASQSAFLLPIPTHLLHYSTKMDGHDVMAKNDGYTHDAEKGHGAVDYQTGADGTMAGMGLQGEPLQIGRAHV